MPREVKLQFVPPLGMASLFSDQATIQSVGDVLLLTFYQIEPHKLSEQEEEKIDVITAYPVARIALRPEAARRLAGGLSKVVTAMSQAAGGSSGDAESA